LKSFTCKGGEKRNNTYPLIIYNSSFSPKNKRPMKVWGKRKRSLVIGIGIALIYYLELELDFIKVKY
jgi:hypothetical protein